MNISLIGLLFCIADGIAVAFYYGLNKKVATAGNPLQITFWICAAHLPPLFVWMWLCLPVHVSWNYFLPGTGVLILTVLGNLFAIHGLSLSPLSLMLPVMCLVPVFTSLIGIPLLQEWPTFQQWSGIVLSVLGILWFYAPKERPWDIFSFWPRFFRERGAPSMVISALCWSLSAPMDKMALQYAEPAFHATFVFSGLVCFLFIWLTVRNEWRVGPLPRPYWGWMIAVGTAGAAADILQLFAVLHTQVGSVEAIKRVTSQVVGLAIGYVLFREGMNMPKLIGIVIISIGIPMIVL